MEITDVIIKPIITEKSMANVQKGVYTFMVERRVNKPAIKQAIEKNFLVKVVSLKTIMVKGKTRLTGRLRKKTKSSDWKKALVKLKKGQKLDIFETTK